VNLELKPFLNILRRATRCGYPSVILNNHLLLQCYNLDIDSDVGLHYVLHIPEDMDPTTEFYDKVLILKPRDILKTYAEGHKELEKERKSQKLMPKACTETVEYIEHKHHLDLVFRYYLAGEEYTTKEYRIDTDVSDTTPEVENCLQAYDLLMRRIKAGGICFVFDGSRMDLQRRIVDCPEVYRYIVKYNGKRILVPFTKSMFLGIKEVDQFYFSIQETLLEDVYTYAISLEKKGIVEQFWGYVLQYQ